MSTSRFLPRLMLLVALAATLFVGGNTLASTPSDLDAGVHSLSASHAAQHDTNPHDEPAQSGCAHYDFCKGQCCAGCAHCFNATASLDSMTGVGRSVLTSIVPRLSPLLVSALLERPPRTR